jgi:hypothetical protein
LEVVDPVAGAVLVPPESATVLATEALKATPVPKPVDDPTPEKITSAAADTVEVPDADPTDSAAD